MKTNPFAECDRPHRVAKSHADTPMYGPALPVKSSRVLTGKHIKKPYVLYLNNNLDNKCVT